MILTDREIRIYIDRELITVDPPPSEIAYASTSLDLTLDPVISTFKKDRPGIDKIIDPTNPAFKSDDVVKELTDSQNVDPDDGFLLNPQILILGWTKEYIDLKESRLAARVEGKSSLARLGLSVHITAPTIHAGFNGRIRLEIVNHGEFPVRLRSGMRICQLIFEQTFGTPDKGYQGQFSSQ